METVLLDWATKATTSDVSRPERPLKQPGEIDRKWFKALFGEETELNRMKKLLNELYDADNDRRLDILGDLEYMCELTHNANVLTKIGGLEKAFAFIIAGNNEEIQVAALNLIGICIPNNPEFCQAVVNNDEWFNVLYALCQQKDSDMLQSKAFWAISGLVKALPNAFTKFLSNPKYVDSLREKISESVNLRVLRRAINLINFIEVEKPYTVGKDLIALLVSCLQRIKDIDCREQIVLLLKMLHDRGEDLGNDTKIVLIETREATKVTRDEDHDPELLLSGIEELLNAFSITQ